MKFGPVSLQAAEGKILGHNIVGPDGRRLLRKGKPLTLQDIQRIQDTGRDTVYVAEMAATDLDEDRAAQRVAAALAGCGIRTGSARNGRVDLHAASNGLLRIDVGRLAALNSHEGVAAATRLQKTPTRTGDKVATIKIIPYAIPEAAVEEIESDARLNGPVVSIQPYLHARVSLIYAGAEASEEKLRTEYQAVLTRLSALDVAEVVVSCVPFKSPDDADLTGQIAKQAAGGAAVILLASDTAIMDRMDAVPTALERAGGRVEIVGAPVDPGNLFMLGTIGQAVVLGIPGCARSRRQNIIDLILPRILAGDPVSREDIVRLGHGGLLGPASYGD